MKPEHWIIIALTATCIYLWTDGCNNPVTNYDVTKMKELQKEVQILKQGQLGLKSGYDSLNAKFNLSLSNTKPVNRKHEKIRETISAMPVDSQLILFSNRFGKGSNR